MELLAALESSAIPTWVRESGSLLAYPAVLTLHTAAMGVLVGSNWAIDLRLLGVAPSVPLAPLVKLFRFVWIGFWINAITGCLLFAADATTKGTTNIFFIKLGIIALAVIVALMMRREVFGKDPERATVTNAGRWLAIASVVLWVAAITTGRLMAYITL